MGDMMKGKYKPVHIIKKKHYRIILSALREHKELDINGIISALKINKYPHTKCNNIVNMTYILMDANLIKKTINDFHQRMYSLTENGIKLIEAYILEQQVFEMYKDLEFKARFVEGERGKGMSLYHTKRLAKNLEEG
jgi:predicted transcriptional regulator